MDVPPSITVSEMRQQLAEDLGFNTNEICLMLGDVELDSQKTLQDYVNESEQTLRLVRLGQHDDFENSSLSVVHQEAIGLSGTFSLLKVEPNPILKYPDSHDQDDNLMYI